MSDYPEIAARFARDTAKHVMTVHLDEGLYRHLKFAKPDTLKYSYELVTWPGNLVIRGDMDDFAFTRHPDMFTFFRDSDGINPQYWANKIFGGQAEAETYSVDEFRRVVAAEVAHDRVLTALVKTEILDNPGIADEDTARSLLDAFEYQNFRFYDAWEWRFREFTDRFLWCCHAIVWGIGQYDAVKAVEARAEAVPVWTPQTAWLFEHASSNWELRYVYSAGLNDAHPKVGWYLEGVGTFCQWMADDLGAAQSLADQHIRGQATA